MGVRAGPGRPLVVVLGHTGLDDPIQADGEAVLRIEGLTKGYGGRALLDGVALHVRADDRIGLVGRNGEGKTTLLRLIAGLEPADDGRIALRRGARIGYLRQEIDPRGERSLIDEVRTAQAALRELEERIRDLEDEMARLGAQGRAVPPALASRYDELREAFERDGGFEAEAELRATLVGLGFEPDRWERELRAFSGGWLMRAELAKLLLARPEVLLLDEPTNHLDIPSIRWFEGVLGSYPGAVIIVSHDRTLLDRHTTRIAELDHGRLTTYAGNYAAYLAQKEQRERESRARQENLTRQIRHAEGFVARFGAKATKASQAESRKKQIAKLRAEREGLALTRPRRSLRFRFRAVPRSGAVVLRLEGVGKAYGELVVYRSLDLEIRRGDRIALVGPNGAGKSTLLRIAAGVLPIDAGTRELGHNVRAAFYAQHQLESLDASRSVLEEIEAHAPHEEVPRLRTLLGTFLFSGDDVNKRVSVLSGGEKARLALAKLLLGEANLLILDEPTNHLDLQAREVVSRALEQFDGTLLFISHDRSLINALANRVLEIERGPDAAQLRMHAGNYDDYARHLEARAASAEPKRRARRAKRDELRSSEATRERERRLRTLRAECEAAENRIDATESEIERLSWLCADPDLARDGDRMREIQTTRRAHEASLRDLYSEWERLSAEIEALEDALAS